MRAPLLALAVALLAAGPAAAADRHASPTGSGEACTTTTPCSLFEAMEGAGEDDVVVVGSGTYDDFEGSSIFPGPPAIRGADPRNPPVITLAEDNTLEFSGSLKDVVVLHPAGLDAGIVGRGGALSVERVTVVQSSAEGTSAAVLAESAGPHTVTDSVFVAPANRSALNVFDADLTVRNVTATGRRGLSYANFSGGAIEGEVTNSILIGLDEESPADFALDGEQITLAVSHSNYDAYIGSPYVTEGEGNQEAPAQLVDLANGDARQLPTSPTRNAGTADSLAGAYLAWRGFSRTMEMVPDIGASEFPWRPSVTTAEASAVTETSATLNAFGDGMTLYGTHRFEYGTTTAYGSSLAPVELDASPQMYSAPITGLTPGTTYHYRAIATTEGGEAVGDDVTFTTKGTAPDPTPPALTGGTYSGRTLSLTLTEAASLQIKVQRARKGRKKGKRCVVGRKRGKRCTKWKTVRTRTEQGVAGENRIRISRKGLERGRYRLRIVATDAAGNASAPLIVRFRVKRR